MSFEYDELNMEDVLRAAGEEVPATIQCQSCGKIGSPSTMKHVDGDSHFGVTYVCAAEFLSFIREPLPSLPDSGWNSELGLYIKSQRNKLLNSTQWTTQRGSPLTEACQDLWVAYHVALNALTITFAEPADVVWPVQPGLEY